MNDFWDKVLPGSVKTDHGKFNSADLLIIVLDLILLGYTCYRSFRFLQNTFAGNDTTGEYTIAAIIALVGLDIAAVAWSLVWMFGSTTKWQDIVSLIMFIVSIIGMVLTSMTDTLTGEGSVPEALRFAAFYGVPAIILLNVAAGITYHMISPQVSLGRKERRLRADMRETQQLGKLAQADTAMRLTLAEEQAKQNDELMRRQKILAHQQIVLDGERLGIARAMSDDEPVRQRGESVFTQLRESVLPSSPPAPQPVRAMNDIAPALPMQQASATSPSPEPQLQPIMFLVHVDATTGSAGTWRVRWNETKEGVHWDTTRDMFGVLVLAEDGITACRKAEEMAKPYLSGGTVPKA